jgi:RNA polymerase sporulation-specific sigma factor
MFWQIFSLFSRFTHLLLGIGTPQKFPPPLSPDEERECIEKTINGDEQARGKLILHNLRLVSHIVRKYYSSGNASEDLVSIGTIGLVKAVDSFSPENGAHFATYAAKCIQNEILMHFRSQKKQALEVSLGETIDVDRDGNPLTYSDVICSDENVSEEVGRDIQKSKALGLVETLLDEREKQIIVLRYGLYGYKALTQREISKHLGISRSYVSRIEKGALAKLAKALT